MLEGIATFWEFYRYGVLFSGACGIAFAFAHEVTKYAVKRWILRIQYK
jgi:hypothetical protein